MLTVTGEDQHQQGGEKGERSTFGENLLEGPPGGDADQKADEEGEDLPRERVDGDKAGGEIKDGTQKRAEGHEGGNELSRTEKFCDPSKGPVVPIEAGKRQEQPVGDDGDEGDKESLFCSRGETKLHPVIIRDGEL